MEILEALLKTAQISLSLLATSYKIGFLIKQLKVCIQKCILHMAEFFTGSREENCLAVNGFCQGYTK